MTNGHVFTMTTDLVLYRDTSEVVEVAQAKDADTKRQALPGWNHCFPFSQPLSCTRRAIASGTSESFEQVESICVSAPLEITIA